MRANWLCGRFCVQASSFENYIAEKAFTDRFVQQSHFCVNDQLKDTDLVLSTDNNGKPFILNKDGSSINNCSNNE